MYASLKWQVNNSHGSNIKKKKKKNPAKGFKNEEGEKLELQELVQLGS